MGKPRRKTRETKSGKSGNLGQNVRRFQTALRTAQFYVILLIWGYVDDPVKLVVQVFGWDSNGTTIFQDVRCALNTASENGGCFYGSGVGVVINGTVMHDNSADNGGCICETYMCRSMIP